MRGYRKPERRRIPSVAGLALLALAIVFLTTSPGAAPSASSDLGYNPAKGESFFDKSLHATGEGMRYWYEKDDGFMQMTGIPYKDLGCKSCHVKSCDQCHVDPAAKTPLAFKTEPTKEDKTCLVCHARAGATIKFDTKSQVEDVHRKAGMTCTSCHSAKDMHGDGVLRHSMRADGAVDAKCENCHTATPDKGVPAFPGDVEAHDVHETLHCNACHVSNTMSCNNCHFDEFLVTKKKAGNFLPSKTWLLLINHKGKVTSANAQSLVTKDKGFVAYAPYFTHSIIRGRACKDCHANENVKKMMAGEKVVMTDLADGKFVPAKGVVPLVEGKMHWNFFNKTADKKGWVKIADPGEPMIQYAVYGTPLTQEQLEAMAEEAD